MFQWLAFVETSKWTSGSITAAVYLEQLSDYQFPNKDSPRSYFCTKSNYGTRYLFCGQALLRVIKSFDSVLSLGVGVERQIDSAFSLWIYLPNLRN
jgi:hypothetical protein